MYYKQRYLINSLSLVYNIILCKVLSLLSALPLNIFLIDLVGRRWTGAVNLFGCGLFFILLQLPVPQSALTCFIFLVRGFSAGMFNFVYIYTSEVRFAVVFVLYWRFCSQDFSNNNNNVQTENIYIHWAIFNVHEALIFMDSEVQRKYKFKC